VKIAPSVLSADFGRLREEIELINRSDADLFHVDIMDGRFVPNISFGFPVMEVLKKYASKPLDVHLMIVEPEKYVEMFAGAGASQISFHLEATDHAHRLLNLIRGLGLKAGLAINPQTGLSFLDQIAGDLDFVNVMSVNPGFGGQKFIASSLKKISMLSQFRKKENLSFEIEVDGGVNLENASLLKEAGANILVAGNYVFKDESPLSRIADLKRI
jgi:ribulose-phosphate 3-epimerase